ncbi:MAG: ABC transporter substrate-binding protein [Mycobacteriales bacterium]
MKSITRVAAAVLAVTVVASACSSASGQNTHKFVDGATMTIAVAQDPGNLDPQNTLLSVDGTFASFAYDPLVYQDPAGKTVSGLAKSWAHAGNTYTFTLHPGVTCSDGTALTASTVAANFSYLADPKNKSPVLGLYIPAGLKASANDAAHTVTLTLPGPFPFFLTGLVGVPIVCQKGLSDRKLLAQHTDGTGAYVLSSAVAGDTYTYTVRKDYTWGPGRASTHAAGTPAKLAVKVITNASTATNLLLSGQVNIADVSQADRSRVDAAHLMHRDVRKPTGQMYFNQAPGRPTADENVRRALVKALDLGQLGKVLTSGTGTPSQGMVTVDPKPCQGDPVKGNLPAHDPTGAGALLDQAGWTKGPNGVREKGGHPLSLTLIYSTPPDTTSSAAELAVSQWKAAGVQVKAVQKPITQISTVLFGTGEFDISWAGLTVQLPNQLVPLVSGAAPPAGTNFAHITNSDYSRLATAALAKSGDTGCADWTAAETALVKAVDVVPYYDSLNPTYAKNASFQAAGGGYIVTSLRMLAG